MITLEKSAVVRDAIRALCEQHGVAIVGTCDSEGIFGEIRIIDMLDIENESQPRTPVFNFAEDAA